MIEEVDVYEMISSREVRENMKEESNRVSSNIALRSDGRMVAFDDYYKFLSHNSDIVLWYDREDNVFHLIVEGK